MSYEIKINDEVACQPVDPTKIEIIDGKVVVTFSNGSVREDVLPNTDLTGYVTNTEFNGHTHLLADITDFNGADYATAAQGAKADTAAQPLDNLSIFTNDLDIATSTGLQTTNTKLDDHVANLLNPHGVTKGQVGLGSVDNTSDTNKPVSTAQQTEINSKYNAAISYTDTGLSNKVDKVLGSRLMTEAEGDKLAELDEKHYRRPTADTTTLAGLDPTTLFDNERRYVIAEGKDYFYDTDAITGDIAPTLQTNGTGFWKTSTTTGSTSSYTQWRLSTGGTFRKNMTNDTILDLQASGLLSVAYTAEGKVTYTTTATKNRPDIELLDRTNHTGTQAINTVENLQTTLDNLIVAITQVEYDDLVTAGTVDPKTLYVIPC